MQRWGFSSGRLGGCSLDFPGCPDVLNAPLILSRSECAGCHEPLSEEEISEGAELCSNCELEKTGTAMIYDLEE